MFSTPLKQFNANGTMAKKWIEALANYHKYSLDKYSTSFSQLKSNTLIFNVELWVFHSAQTKYRDLNRFNNFVRLIQMRWKFGYEGLRGLNKKNHILLSFPKRAFLHLNKFKPLNSNNTSQETL